MHRTRPPSHANTAAQQSPVTGYRGVACIAACRKRFHPPRPDWELTAGLALAESTAPLQRATWRRFWAGFEASFGVMVDKCGKSKNITSDTIYRVRQGIKTLGLAFVSGCSLVAESANEAHAQRARTLSGSVIVDGNTRLNRRQSKPAPGSALRPGATCSWPTASRTG
jgi:hypothetical protein